ncbi:MAG: c-type cytochrome [Hyphomicrobiaceae bacterium]
MPRRSTPHGLSLICRVQSCAVAIILAFVPLWAKTYANDNALAVAGHLVGHGGPIKTIASDQKSGQLITGSFDYAMMLWKLNEDGIAKRLKRFDDHDGAVSSVLFHPDGHRALAGSDDGVLHVWDLHSGTRFHLLSGHEAKILGLATDADGQSAASASWDGTVRVWDLTAGRVRHILKGHTGPVNAVSFSRDGKTVASAASDGTIRLWDAQTGALRRVAYRHGWGINVLQRVGAGDHYLFGALDGSAGIFDPEADAVVVTLKAHEKPVLSIAVLDKPGLVATGGGGGEIRIYRQGDWRLLETYRNPLGPIWAMAFADRGARIYFGSLDDHATSWQIRPRKPFEQIASKFPRRFQIKNDVSLGELQFARKCSICHTLTPDGANRAGPTLYGVFGRKAGSLKGYPYSPALKSLSLTWTAETIGKLFELGPHDYTPGSKMPLQRIAEKEKRDSLISFLQIATAKDKSEAAK